MNWRIKLQARLNYQMRKTTTLETSEVKQRLEKIIEHLAKEIKVLEIEHNIASKTQNHSINMFDQVLRERMRPS